MDKGMLMWMIFIAVFAIGMLVSFLMKKGIKENGIETNAVVSRIVDNGTPTEIDINVYVRFTDEYGEETEAVISNPRSDLREGLQVRIKYHPRFKTNARLV